MKYYPFCLLLALPLTVIAQDSPAAIIVDDENEVIETDLSFAEFDTPMAEDQSPDESEPDNPNYPADKLDEPEETAALEDEVLPEQPEDLRLAEPEESVVVKVEIPKQIELSKAASSDFKLITPWAPKPMQSAPLGWRYIPAQQDKAYPIEVKLSTGKILSLHITPYILVPETSNKAIQAREPGYQPERGYQQVHSVSARLQSASDNLKQAGDSLDHSIENLSALVDSLPK